jgi:hypothetical protein
VHPGLVQSRVADAAQRFGISDALHLKVGGYSTGMRARLTRVEPQAPSLEQLYFAIRRENAPS